MSSQPTEMETVSGIVKAGHGENAASEQDTYPEEGNRDLNEKKKVIECKTCSEQFLTRYSKILHELQHKKSTLLCCKTCKKTFQYPNQMRQHVKTQGCKFACSFCGKKYTSKRILKDHMNAHAGNFFKCRICHKTFSSFEYLKENHMPLHSEQKNYICDLCGKTFKSKATLQYHISKHMQVKLPISFRQYFCQTRFLKHTSSNRNTTNKKLVRSYKCQVCKRTFAGLDNFGQHRKRHLGKISSCDLCQKEFLCADDMRKHKKDVHYKRRYECPICHKMVARRVCHMRTHLGERPFKCDVCNRAFAVARSLKLHILKKHFDGLKKKFKCKLCDKRYALECDLRSHFRNHEQKKTVKCKICDKELTGNQSLRNHLLVHSGEKPFKCKLCNVTFRKKNHLNIHQLTHTKAKAYKCDQCDKEFGYANSLKRHLRVHAGIYPYSCSFCGKSFVESGGMKRHVRIHTGYKPYKCEKCGEGFLQKLQWRYHMKSHEEPIDCPECDKIIPAQHWKRHKTLHDMCKQEPQQCPHCEKTYLKPKALKTHIAKYHNE